MDRVRAWLTWSPFARGTWQQLALNLATLLVTMTIVQASFGVLNASNWLGGLSGIVVVGVVLGVPTYRRPKRLRTD